MPKETFLNLSTEKQQRFLRVALEEFAQHDFQTASISQIVKKMEIAKGSVYQYFEDKLDLWLFLKQYCEGIKIGYIQSLKRADYTDFWAYYRAQFEHGINFDLEHPLCSLFLYRVGQQENSPQTRPYTDEWKKQAMQFMQLWVQQEQQQGTFRNDVSVETIAHFMVAVSISIADLLRHKYSIDFEQNIRDGKPLFAADKQAVMAAVDELITLMRSALSSIKYQD